MHRLRGEGVWPKVRVGNIWWGRARRIRTSRAGETAIAGEFSRGGNAGVAQHRSAAGQVCCELDVGLDIFRLGFGQGLCQKGFFTIAIWSYRRFVETWVRREVVRETMIWGFVDVCRYFFIHRRRIGRCLRPPREEVL